MRPATIPLPVRDSFKLQVPSCLLRPHVALITLRNRSDLRHNCRELRLICREWGVGRPGREACEIKMSEITIKPHFGRTKLTMERYALFFCAALFLTILSPFGTDSQLTAPLRFVYWFGVILGGAVVAIIVSKFFLGRATSVTGMRRALVMSAQIVTASMPISLLVAGMEMWLREPLSWAHLPQVFGYVVTITAVITVSSSFLEQHKLLKENITAGVKANQDQSRSNTMLATTRFHHRLDPLRRKSEILMLKAEDHYLHVVTSAGSELIRCTMKAAMDELNILDGQRVHRSYWVARSAISNLEKRGNRRVLIMKDGTVVPMSRQFSRELSKNSWLPT